MDHRDRLGRLEPDPRRLGLGAAERERDAGDRVRLRQRRLARRSDRLRADDQRRGARRVGDRHGRRHAEPRHRRARLDHDLRRVPRRRTRRSACGASRSRRATRSRRTTATPAPRRRSGQTVDAAARRLRPLAGGGLLVAGDVVEERNRRFTAWKFGADGTPDAGWGTAGVASPVVGGSARARTTSCPPPAAGYYAVGYGTDDDDYDTLAVVRFTAAGTLDSGFSGDGILLAAAAADLRRRDRARVQRRHAVAVPRRRRHGRRAAARATSRSRWPTAASSSSARPAPWTRTRGGACVHARRARPLHGDRHARPRASAPTASCSSTAAAAPVPAAVWRRRCGAPTRC